MSKSILGSSDINSALRLRKAPTTEEFGDRFIPNEISANLFDLYFHEEPAKISEKKANQGLADLLQSELLDTHYDCFSSKENNSSKKKPKLVKFGTGEKRKTEEKKFSRNLDKELSYEISRSNTYRRKISSIPHKILDAPGLEDDYYLNLMDWSSKDQLAIGLGPLVYLWGAKNSQVTKLIEYEQDKICSVSWASEGSQLAVGNTSGEIELFDVNKMKSIRVFEGHTSRVGALDWNNNVIASGGKDKSILLHDSRDYKDYFSSFNVRLESNVRDQHKKCADSNGRLMKGPLHLEGMTITCSCGT